jgi:hypothetical protein
VCPHALRNVILGAVSGRSSELLSIGGRLPTDYFRTKPCFPVWGVTAPLPPANSFRAPTGGGGRTPLPRLALLSAASRIEYRGAPERWAGWPMTTKCRYGNSF